MKHSLNDWLYPNSLYNPNCPQVAGCAGLMYSSNGLDEFKDDSDEVFRTIVRHRTESLWEYMGQYIQIRAPSLTQVEWLQQDVKVMYFKFVSQDSPGSLFAGQEHLGKRNLEKRLGMGSARPGNSSEEPRTRSNSPGNRRRTR